MGVRENNVKGNYKALIYCSSIDDAKSVYKLINVNLENSLKNFKLDIKRGCTEFDLAFPGYKDIKKIKLIPEIKINTDHEKRVNKV